MPAYCAVRPKHICGCTWHAQYAAGIFPHIPAYAVAAAQSARSDESDLADREIELSAVAVKTRATACECVHAWIRVIMRMTVRRISYVKT